MSAASNHLRARFGASANPAESIAQQLASVTVRIETLELSLSQARAEHERLLLELRSHLRSLAREEH